MEVPCSRGVHSDLPVGAPTMNSLDLLCGVPACVVIGDINVDNAFICLKTVIFRSVLSVLVADVEGMTTKALHGLLEGF